MLSTIKHNASAFYLVLSLLSLYLSGRLHISRRRCRQRFAWNFACWYICEHFYNIVCDQRETTDASPCHAWLIVCMSATTAALIITRVDRRHHQQLSIAAINFSSKSLTKNKANAAICIAHRHEHASNALLLPASRRWSPLASHQSGIQDDSVNTARPRARAGVSRNMPVYFPGCRQVLIPACTEADSGWVGLGAWLRAEVVYSFKDSHPARH